MATRRMRFTVLILLAGFVTGHAAAADEQTARDAASRQGSVDAEQLLATPAAPIDNRGFQPGDSVTLVREVAGYKRTVIYLYAGDARWQLVSNSLKAKAAP